MSSDISDMLARLKPLPLRLRIAHLSALLRCGRVTVRDGLLFYPSPRGAVGREGRSVAEARVGGTSALPRSPHPDARLWLASTSRASLLASDPTASRGEGSITSDGRKGHAG